MSFFSGQEYRESILGILTGASIPLPLNNDVFIGLGSSVPTALGANFNELSGGGYSRRSYPIGTSYWSEPVARTIFNTQPIEFSRATSNWLLAVSIAVFEAATGSTVYAMGTNDLSKAINALDGLYLPPGALKISESNIEGKTRKSNALAHAILGIFRQQSPEPISNLFLALGSTVPDYQAETIGELTGKGYTRIPIAANSTNFTISNRTATNQVEFVSQASTSDWLPIKSFGLYKSLTGGASDLLYYGELPKDAVVFKDDKVIVPISSIEIKE